MTAHRWRKDAPPQGVWCEVWFLTQVVTARFDGSLWRDDIGRVLRDVTHWREC